MSYQTRTKRKRCLFFLSLIWTNWTELRGSTTTQELPPTARADVLWYFRWWLFVLCELPALTLRRTQQVYGTPQASGPVPLQKWYWLTPQSLYSSPPQHENWKTEQYKDKAIRIQACYQNEGSSQIKMWNINKLEFFSSLWNETNSSCCAIHTSVSPPSWAGAHSPSCPLTTPSRQTHYPSLYLIPTA